jgi:hypothetical protein
LRKKREFKEAVHQLFIDFKNTCDSVMRVVFYNILSEFGIPMKLVRLKKCVWVKPISELGSANICQVSKHFLLFHNDAHNYKITGILKQLKFRRSLWHVSVHAGTIIREPFLCLAKRLQLCFYPRRLWLGQ